MGVVTDLEQTIRAIVRDELAKSKPAELVSVAAYAEARSISESTVRVAIREGRLDVVRYGRTGRAVRVRATDEIGERPPSPLAKTPTERALRFLRSVR